MAIKDQLFTHAHTYISLDQLEVFSNTSTYEQLAEEIQLLVEEGVLSGVKSAGQNGKKPSLFYKYRIQKAKLRQDIHQEIERARLRLHPSLCLDEYFRSSPYRWYKDLPYIEKISEYLNQNGFPVEEEPAPHRSLALVGDEKWIQEKGGESLLVRLGIWNKLNIIPVHDPLSFAFNPKAMAGGEYLHLIVENKTTYEGLLGALTETSFTTLIYGKGFNIVKSIEHFLRQIPLEGRHILYYFGDIDWEGIKIWHLLNQKMEVHPAVPFYELALTKQSIPVKKDQQPNKEANEAFFVYFDEPVIQQVLETLNQKQYFPQEVLSSKELRGIWRDSDWKNCIKP